MKKVDIYTDGACSYNPGPGGWGAILIYKGTKKEFSGAEENTTNNKMELQAVIEALKALKEPCKVFLHSDSAYIVNAFENDWISTWQKNNWKTSNNKPVKNVEQWQQLLALCKTHDVTFVKVKGHADDQLNNRCDELARAEVEKLIAANPQLAQKQNHQLPLFEIATNKNNNE
jgi:ribonuclease HI